MEGVALRVTGTVPLPLGDPSTQRSMNRVVAQQELERQNFRVRGSGGDAVFRPAARWLRPPFPVTVRLTQGISGRIVLLLCLFSNSRMSFLWLFTRACSGDRTACPAPQPLNSGFVIELLPTAVDGRYDLAAYRAVFALQGGLILLVCSFYFGSRDPLKKL